MRGAMSSCTSPSKTADAAGLGAFREDFRFLGLAFCDYSLDRKRPPLSLGIVPLRTGLGSY